LAATRDEPLAGHTFHAVLVWMRTRRDLASVGPLVAGAVMLIFDQTIGTGFYDLPHFDKVFRRRIGLSPREYRSRYRGGAGRPVRILEA
jgi:transcriptional regulator GlxA family with amidase domain